MTATISRPDLSARTVLSKSALNAFEWCPTAAWFDLHDRRPMIPSERVSFGAAVDRAVEPYIWRASGMEIEIPDDGAVADDAADAIYRKDEIALDRAELARAIRGFREEVIPRIDWTEARTQVELRADIDGIGIVEGHPDILLPGKVWDVKTASRPKTVPSLELGIYGLLAEAAEGQPIDEVGYLTWVRAKYPKWEIQPAPATNELRRWAWEHLSRQARLRAVDAELNRGLAEPVNSVFIGGPKFLSKCLDCQYAPANGGSCALAYQGGTEE